MNDSVQPNARPAPTRSVGAYVPMIDGPEKTSGRAKFTADIAETNALEAAILRSPYYAHAELIAVDVSKAATLPGVRAVITGDVSDAALADYDPVREHLTVRCTTQVPYYVHLMLAKALKLDRSQIRVIKPYLGGSFGARAEDLVFGSKITEGLKRAIPMGRLARPTDYPGLVVFLDGDDANFITGQTISVSGGLTTAG